MSQDNDDDYMNDELILQCEAAAASSKKSSSSKFKETSLASTVTRRQIAIEKRRKADIVQQKRFNPRVRLEEGLSTAISEENVGFKLLSKMGYKPGSGLGKSHSGRSEPVPLEFRQGRSGLGREAIRSKIEAEREAARQKIVDLRRSNRDYDEKQFAEMQRRRTNEYRTKRDLFSARKACVDLDNKVDITQPFKPFYWPESALPKKQDEPLNEEVELSSDDSLNTKDIPGSEIPIEEQLEEVSAYLRLQHKYCLWCGCVFDDSEDLATNCPGPSAEFHE